MFGWVLPVIRLLGVEFKCAGSRCREDGGRIGILALLGDHAEYPIMIGIVEEPRTGLAALSSFV